MRTGTPEYRRIQQYLADYAADRALVHTDLHRAQVDRIYRFDPRVAGWTVAWDDTTRTPYAKRGNSIIYPAPGIDPVTAIYIAYRALVNGASTPL